MKKYEEFNFSNLSYESLREIAGVNNENIKTLEDLLDYEIIFRGTTFQVPEKHMEQFKVILNKIIDLANNGNHIDQLVIKQIVDSMGIKHEQDLSFLNKVVITTKEGKPIKIKTKNQALLFESLNNNDIIFSVGPAGTGKTFLSIVGAVNALKNGDVKKIILTRPAVEAGESLGFLPGDLKDKIDPYLMPLYDSLFEILGNEQVENLLEKKVIEVIPLAYMRGRTLNDCFVILDEAQNTTKTQMLMFLTRLGYNSKMVINGDITQIDLDKRKGPSGLSAAIYHLEDIDKIAIIEFGSQDIVRNPLVETIVKNFEI